MRSLSAAILSLHDVFGVVVVVVVNGYDGDGCGSGGFGVVIWECSRILFLYILIQHESYFCIISKKTHIYLKKINACN